MYTPNEKEFVRLAKKGNLIPVYKEIVTDMETPVSAYRKIESEYSFLLESIEGGEKVARYSFIGTCAPSQVVKPKSLENIRKYLKQYQPLKVEGLPRFHGGLVGYISYDVVREIEPKLKKSDHNPDDLKLPLMQLLLTDTLLAFDHIKHKILIISNAHVKGNAKAAYREACRKIDKLEKKLRRPLKLDDEIKLPKKPLRDIKAKSNLSKTAYEKMVKKAKERIRAGDIIQVVLSQRFETACEADPFSIYRVLRIINPSPYMYYLRMGSLRVVGSSPEVMVRLEKGTATLRPIAGTRPRGKDAAEDEKMEKELLASKKERTYHAG